MIEFLKQVGARFQSFHWTDALDILLLTALFFFVYRFIRRRRAFPILIGGISILLVHVVAKLTNLPGLYALTSAFFSAGLIFIAILFQPEIRALFEKLGATVIAPFNRISGQLRTRETHSVAELKKAILRMSQTQTGALIIIEHMTGIDDIVQSGCRLDALISSDLILNIFFRGAPLHDGAVVIREGRICAAGCFLPISADRELNTSFGSRHRAALEMSRSCDATVIVVSEEDGLISYAEGGELNWNVDEQKLTELLWASLSYRKS